MMLIINQTTPASQFSSDFSDEAKSFVIDCFTHDYSRRPNAEQLLSHVFLNKNRKPTAVEVTNIANDIKK